MMTEDFDFNALFDDVFVEGDGGESQLAEHGQEKVIPPSPTALVVDRWGHSRGEELAENQEFNHESHDPNLLADTHAAAFEPRPRLADNPEERLKARWIEDLINSPDYHALHSSTALDTGLSEIAAYSLAGKFKQYHDSLDENEKREAEAAGDDESVGSQMKRIRSIGNALKESSEDVQDAKDACQGLGGEGGTDGSMDPQETIKLFKRIREDYTLQEIMRKAGRYRRLAQSLQRQKTQHGVDDVVGVECSGDIPRILPSELVCISDPILELLTLRKIAERSALSRQHEGYEPVGRGPIVVVVDESGSMGGEPHENAKAFALAMGWIAKSQNRWCGFIGFSGGTEGTRIAFPPHEWDSNVLMDWLCHFYGGGTTLDVPLNELPNKYWDELGCPKGKTDIVIITDAIVHAPAKMVENFNAWKQQEQANCYGIVIGSAPGDLEQVCDRTWTVNNFNIEQGCVSELLSI